MDGQFFYNQKKGKAMHITYITPDIEKGKTFTNFFADTKYKITIHKEIESLIKAAKYIKSDIVLINIEECIKKEYLYKQLEKELPNCITIFITKYSNQAAGLITASKYEFIQEPIQETIIKRIIKNYEIKISDKKLYIQTIPTLKTYISGKEIHIKGQKTKEILAYLIDNNGNPIHKNQIIKALWPQYKETNYALLRNTISKLNKEFEKYGIHEIIKRQSEYRYINKKDFESDLKNILETLQGIETYENKYLEEYPSWNTCTKKILNNLKKNLLKE